MIKGLLVLAVLCFAQVSTLTFSETESNFDKIAFFFHKFNVQHKKEHKSYEEFIKRLIIFSENLAKFPESVLFEEEEPKFSPFFDVSQEEFAKTHLNTKFNPSYTKKLKQVHVDYDYNLPDEKDWRKDGVVTPVKNQGQCGSCWAFSTVGTVESQNAIVNKKLISLSESQVVDCDNKGVNKGCDGGLMINALDYLIKEGGIMSENDYSYVPKQEKCKFDKSKIAVTVTDHEVVDPVEGNHDETKLLQVLYNRGPVAIAINATPLQFYPGGIFDIPFFPSAVCNPASLNHGVLLVGFGVVDNKPYWIVKNSWGAAWGESGYFRIARGKNLCGLANENNVVAVVRKN